MRRDLCAVESSLCRRGFCNRLGNYSQSYWSRFLVYM